MPDMSNFYEQHKAVQPFLQTKPGVDMTVENYQSKADRAKSSATAEKGRQKGSAEGVITSAQTAVSAARTSLDDAPAGKGTEADIEALRADLSAADADLSAARSAVGSEDFADAETKAKSAEAKAAQVSNGVQMAVQKYHELVEAARPWYDRI